VREKEKKEERERWGDTEESTDGGTYDPPQQQNGRYKIFTGSCSSESE